MQIDHVFKQVFGKAILSAMHHISQILNFGNLKEFQNKGNAFCNSYGRWTKN